MIPDYDFNEWIRQFEVENEQDRIRMIHPVIIPPPFTVPKFVEV